MSAAVKRTVSAAVIVAIVMAALSSAFAVTLARLTRQQLAAGDDSAD